MKASNSTAGQQLQVQNDYYSQSSNFTKDNVFYYSVMPGNYPATMRTVMNKRGNWVEVRSMTHDVTITYRSPKKMP